MLKTVINISHGYVRRGQDLIIRANPGWDKEIECVNRKKNGAPYQYADSLFAALAAVKVMLNMPYRNLQGMAIEILGEENTPDYSTICKRIQKLDVETRKNLVTVTGRNGDRFAFIADSTGIKQHNRSEWMQKKWGLSRGFVKLHALVNADTNAIRVTDDSKADAPMFLELLDDALDGIEDGADVSVLGDGAYGSRKNIAGCAERGVTPNLKVNITSGTKGTSRTWAEAVGNSLVAVLVAKSTSCREFPSPFRIQTLLEAVLVAKSTSCRESNARQIGKNGRRKLNMEKDG